MSIFDLLLKRAESDQGIDVANKKKYYSNILLIDRSVGTRHPNIFYWKKKIINQTF